MTSRNKDAKKTGTTAKYVRPAGYSKRYEERRRKDGRRCRLGIRRFREILSSVLDAEQSRDIPYVMCLLYHGVPRQLVPQARRIHGFASGVRYGIIQNVAKRQLTGRATKR